MMMEICILIQIMKGKSVQKKQIKKHLPTPVLLIDQSEELSNTVIISKMVAGKQNTSSIKNNNVFTGGFKYRPEDIKDSKNNKITNQSALINESKMDKFTVYDEFGIIADSIGNKKKYRDPAPQLLKQQFEQNNPLNNANPMRNNGREEANNNNWNENVYEVAKVRGREQIAEHFKSSLDVINLQNIEAKLQAHRLSMKPIEQQYNHLKGKPTNYANLDQIQPKYKFNTDIDAELNALQGPKVYDIIKQKQTIQEKQPEERQLQKLWEEKIKNDPKLAEYDFKYQQFLVQKQAKNIVSSVVREKLFTWDKYAKKQDLQHRKQVKKHKSKPKIQVSSQKMDDDASPAKEPKSLNHQDIANVLASKDDKFIAKLMMAEIDTEKRGLISKEELNDYITVKEHIIKAYHIDLKWLHTDLDNFETKRKGLLTQADIALFLASLETLHHPSMELKTYAAFKEQHQPIETTFEEKTNKLYTSYFKENVQVFERLFVALDVNDDRIIKRQEFIDSIFTDSQCSKIIDKVVIKIHPIDKSITFKQIIGCILDDFRKEKNQKLKKSKEYITFQRFKEYFEIPESLDLGMMDQKKNQKLKKKSQSVEYQIFDIEPEYLFLLKDIYSSIPRIYQDYIVANDFISLASRDPQILAVSDDLCRIQSHQTNLPVETIKSTLLRMGKQCDQYANWEILKLYFSRRGRPLDWDFQLIKNKKQIRQHKFRATTDFVKTHQLGFNQMKSGFEKSVGFKGQLTGKLGSKNNKSIEKYTIPKPFNITDEVIKKKSKFEKEMSSEKKQMEELQKQFKAKPVNKQILEPKPDLILGKKQKTNESFSYNYQNYQNDRIERALKKAQEAFELEQQIKQIKTMSIVKAKTVDIDLKKKLEDVMKDQKNAKAKHKPTVPNVGSNLYPEKPDQQNKRKIQKIKKNMQKQDEAEKMRDQKKKQIKDKAKQKNEQAKQLALDKKKRQQEEKKQIQNLDQNDYKPKIKKYQTTEAQKQSIKSSKQQKQRKKQQTIQKMLEAQEQRKKKVLGFQKKEKKLEIDGLTDEQILERFDEIDFEDILLTEEDKIQFRKQYGFSNKTKKEVKQRLSGLAGRERAGLEYEDKRLMQQKKKVKEEKQGKLINEKIESGKELNDKVSSTLNVDTNFHRSNALRRYRALMEGKTPQSEFDKYSVVGALEKQEI